MGMAPGIPPRWYGGLWQSCNLNLRRRGHRRPEEQNSSQGKIGGHMDGFAYGIAAGTVIAIIVVIYRWIAGLNINPFD
jgi:hypothetical protein